MNPLDPVEGGFWDIVKFDPPGALLKQADTLTKIRGVSRLTAQVNEMIRISGFNEQLQKYDELLQQFQGELITALDAVRGDLG